MIVVAVLTVLSVLFVVGVQLGNDVLVATRFSSRSTHEERAYYVARSIIQQTLKLFPAGNTNYDSLQDPWAQPLPTLPLDDMLVTLTVEDEERRFNLVTMVPNGKADDARAAQFRRLLEGLGYDPNLANAVLDWEDSDSEPRYPGGAEALDYPAYPCKNGPLDSVAELLVVKGCTPQMYEGTAPDPNSPVLAASPAAGQTEGVPGLKYLCTVRSSGQVNVNTATPYVLRSISEDMPAAVADAIIKQRTDKPFAKLNDLLQVPGFEVKYLYRFQQLAGVQSQVFRVTARVQSSTGFYSARVYMKRQADHWVPMAWEVHG